MSEESLSKKTKTGLYWKFAEQFSNYGIQFIIGIAMARMLSPEDYGITALPGVFIMLANIFVGAGFGEALVRKPDLKEVDLSTAFYYSFCVGLFFYILLFIGAPYIALFYNIPVLTPLMRVTALSFIFNAIGAPQAVLLRRDINFRVPAKIGVVSTFVSGIVGVVMAYVGYGVWALVISSLVTSFISQISLVIIVRWKPRTRWSKESFRYLWGYGSKMMSSAILDTVYNNITPIIVGKYFSTADLGIYNRAVGYSDLPSKNIHAVVRDVSFPVLSKLQDDSERLILGYRRMIKLSCFVIFPAMMLLAGLAHPLVIIMVTAKWEACIILLQLMCFDKMWYPVHALNLNILMVVGRSDLFLKLEVIKKVLGLVVIFCSLPFGLTAFCASGIGASLISLFINTWYTGKLYKFGFRKQMKDLLPTLLLSLFVFVISLTATYLFSNMFLQIIIGGIIGTIFYIGGAYFFKFQALQDALYMLKRKH